MLLLLNSKNNNTKKDLWLSYTQRNKSAYPTTAKAMTRYLSTQYLNKNIVHQCSGKEEDKNGKKGDDSKPEDKDNNTTGTVGAHVVEVTNLKIPLLLLMNSALALTSRKLPNTSLGQHNL